MSKVTPISHEMSLGSRLREARENYQYWKRQCELRFDPDAQREAGARMIAWKHTAAAIEAEIDALKPSH